MNERDMVIRPGNGVETSSPVTDSARRLTDAVKERALATTEDRKGILADQLGTLVNRLERMMQTSNGKEPEIADRLIDRGVAALRQVQHALEDNSTEQLLRKAGEQIKARPGLFVGGFAVLGFIAARLVRR